MIRKMEITDIFQVVKIEKKVFKTTLGENFLFEELTSNPFANYYIYELNSEIIGYIGVRIYDSNAEILNFVIDTNHQKKGYGSNLFQYVLNYLEQLNVKQITLEVRKSNTQAKRFYQKYGFVKSHIRKEYYDNNEDAIVYLKEV